MSTDKADVLHTQSFIARGDFVLAVLAPHIAAQLAARPVVEVVVQDKNVYVSVR